MSDYIKESFNYKGFKITVQGYSVAARKTCFYIEDLNIMLDAGVTSFFRPSHIFITHCHHDHCFNLPLTIQDIDPKIYCPMSMVSSLKNFIISSYVLSQVEKTFTIIGVNNCDKFKLVLKNRKFEVEIFQCFHSVDSIGYGFTEIVDKLKPEYIGLKTEELVQIKETESITEELYKPRFLYLGDTNKEILKNENILKYPIIFIECTFLTNEDLNNHIKRNNNELRPGTYGPMKLYDPMATHMCWTDLQQFGLQHIDNFFILFHFSARYKNEDFEKLEKLSNFKFWYKKL